MCISRCVTGRSRALQQHPSPHVKEMPRFVIKARTTQKRSISPVAVKNEAQESSLTQPPEEPEYAVHSHSECPSELEQRRLKNIEDNARFLAELEIDNCKVKTMARSPPKHSPKNTFRKIPRRASPAREPMSLRSRTKTTGDVRAISLAASIQQSVPAATELYQRKPKGQLELKKYWLNRESEEPINALPSFPLPAREPVEMKRSDRNASSRFAAELDAVRLEEQRVAKVVRSRVCSVAVHPGPLEMPIMAVGDKEGQIGIWQVGAADGPLTFDFHSSAVYCLKFRASDPGRLYSCSYDGSLRCCHFEKGVCDELYRTDDASDNRLTFFDQESPHSMLVATSDGSVVRVDERTGMATELRLGAGNLKTVHVHPQKTDYFATASSTGLVQIWDSRHLGGGRAHCIISLPSSRTVYSAFFSPIDGHRLLSTSADDTLKLYDTTVVGDAKLSHTVNHNNHTGRWLTTFKATWHPSRDDIFVVGSMHYPRRIEVYNDKGSIVKLFYSDYLSSVCSINAFHPTMNVIAGGNSSGRLHVFMST